MEKELLGRDSPGNLYIVENGLGSQRSLESTRKKSKAFGFSKA